MVSSAHPSCLYVPLLSHYRLLCLNYWEHFRFFSSSLTHTTQMELKDPPSFAQRPTARPPVEPNRLCQGHLQTSKVNFNSLCTFIFVNICIFFLFFFFLTFMNSQPECLGIFAKTKEELIKKRKCVNFKIIEVVIWVKTRKCLCTQHLLL